MSDFVASGGEVLDWLRSLMDAHPLFFPRKHGKVNYRFAEVDACSLLQFQTYRPTVVPPVKIIVPAREELFKFLKKPDGAVELTPSLDTSFRVLAGVRPCDLKGLFLMDLFFQDGVEDPYYLARRENTAVIGYACSAPCDDRAFCAAVDSLDHRKGADVFLTPVRGDLVLIEAQTDRGRVLLDGVGFDRCNDGPARKVGAVADRPDDFGRPLKAGPGELADMIGKQWKSPVWDKHVERCFSCGSCNLVCPTCYCFDVYDDMNLDATSGSRERTWDGCMLPNFSIVAGQHNFRPDPASRQRHRVKRKFEYLPRRFDHGSVCVGCGRCGRQCTSGIDIHDIVNDLCEPIVGEGS